MRCEHGSMKTLGKVFGGGLRRKSAEGGMFTTVTVLGRCATEDGSNPRTAGNRALQKPDETI